MKKILLIAILSISLFQLKLQNTLANNNFYTNAKIEYKFHETGNATVTNTITIKNLTTESHAKTYFLNLQNLEPKNILAYEKGQPIDVGIFKEAGKTRIKLNFKEKVLGVNKERTFVITYEEEGFAVKTGDIWEVSIPKLSDIESFNSYNVVLSIPLSFGEKAYLTPQEKEAKIEKDRIIYIFDEINSKNRTITAGFGRFQVFTFNLNYHLENNQNKSSPEEIAIPPDTSTQKVYYQSIKPLPVNIAVDEDGNWLAKYKLRPKEVLDITVTGYAKIFSEPHSLLTPIPSNLLANSQANQYWQSNDPKIKTLASWLKTPEKIYQYVTEHLNYDHQRAKPFVERMGARLALENPDDAICMEFTDLFIALARAAGIPAREINGFAYSENIKIQPLSLVADVLHAWPEYWDEKKNTWVPIDPTWGSTTGGVDFFNKLDLRHFAFVIHGKNPIYPPTPGSYKSDYDPKKDIYVDIASLPEDEPKSLKIEYEITQKASLFNQSTNIKIVNDGSSAFYNLSPLVTFDSEIVTSDFIEVLPPYSHHTLELTIPYGILAKNAPTKIEATVNGVTLEIPNMKQKAVTYQLLILFIILLTIVIALNTTIFKRKTKK